MKKRMMIIALLCIGVQGAWAQAVADNGKSVKRITFDREWKTCRRPPTAMSSNCATGCMTMMP